MYHPRAANWHLPSLVTQPRHLFDQCWQHAILEQFYKLLVQSGRRDKGGCTPYATMAWNIGSNAIWAMSGVSLKPVTTATDALAEDSKIGIAKSTTKRLRFLVSNTNSISSGSVQYQLQMQQTATCASGTYTAVPTTATLHWQIVDSAYITDAEATVDSTSLTNPGGYTFVAGQLKDAGNTTAGITLNASQFTEMEFSVQATANATAGGDYCFKLFNSTGAALNTYTNYAQARVNGTTAIKLLSFAATGAGEAVRVGWTTAQESENKGFNLYRGSSPAGPFEKLNGGLISSGSVSGEGRSYEFIDTAVSRGAIYYYKLEDVDVSGTRDAARSGVRGLGRGRDAGRLGDCLRAEPGGERRQSGQRRGRGAELAGVSEGHRPVQRGHGRRRDQRRSGEEEPGVLGRQRQQLERGCERAGARLRQPGDDSRTYDEELRRNAGDGRRSGLRAAAGAGLRARLYTGTRPAAAAAQRDPAGHPGRQTGAGRGAGRTSRVLAGYRVYPAPLHQAGANNQVAELFSWDEAAYRENAYYPAVAAELSTEYVFRGQAQQRLIFYPLRFNPGTGELLHYERLRVRVEVLRPALPPRRAPA